MGAIDFILNLACLLLWLSWRTGHFDPLANNTPASLIGTLKRADQRRLKGWQLAAALSTILGLRAVLDSLIGSPAGWTPTLNLELVVLAFRSDVINADIMFSLLSFIRFLVVFYFWLLVLAILNRKSADSDPIQKLVRLHLGGAARWPWPIQLVLPLLGVNILWIVVQPALVYLGVIARAHSLSHLVEQGSLVGVGLLLSLKYLLPPFLLLHLVASYIYMGTNPMWDFVATTAANLTAPLRRLPLRFAKLDFKPVAAVFLILGLLQWLPNAILNKLATSRLSTWPQ